MKQRILMLAILAVCAGLVQAQSVFNLKTGLFMPSMTSDIWDFNVNNLAFNKGDMSGLYYAAEYEFFLNRTISFAFEVGNYTQTVYSQYRDYEDNSHNPIYQNIKLSITPIEMKFKLYPLGLRYAFSPFIGIGGGLYVWRYENWGDFIDFSTMDILTDREAVTHKVGLGASVCAGFLVKFDRRLAFLVEGKYQYLKDSLSGDFSGFGNIDLSGVSVLAGFSMRF
jgi:hypothetical protein